jgi:hypothetical protein
VSEPDDLPTGDARLLSHLTREAREAPLPDVDFDRLEAALMAKVEKAPQRSTGRTLWYAVGGLAAAAAAILVFSAKPPTAPEAPVAKAPVVTPPAAPVARTEHVDATSGPKTFSREGLATWVLETGAVADVTDEGERVVVALRSGAIHVDVIPQPVKERFVVLVDQTRVAVHGTVFRVARSGTSVDVDVERGVVAVGASGEAPRWMVPAPSGGTFRTDATDGALRALVPFTALAPVAVVSPSPRSPVVVPSAPKGPTTTPTVGEKRIEAAELRSRASALASDCFQAKNGLAPNVHVTVDTTLKLVTDDKGTITATFDPPLAPPVEACVREGLRSLKANAGADDVRLSLVGRK